MIALPNQLPLLQYGDHEVDQYESRWLKDSITEAAHKAGHNDWWFANEIAQAVIEYLRHRFAGTVITIDALYDKIEQVLSHLGWRDIASALQVEPPPIRISLVEIATEAGSGYELNFFELLRRRVREIASISPRQIQVYGLRDAVMEICGAKRWSQRCDSLRAEIIETVREEVCLRAESNRKKLGLVLS